MKFLAVFAIAGALMLPACLSPKKSVPHIYRGGQYYGDAVHE